MFLKIGSIVLIVLQMACVSRPAPILEYTLARENLLFASALRFKPDANSSQKAAALKLKAEEYFKQGETAFDKQDYDEAEKAFRLSRIFSEKLEVYHAIKETENESNP